MELSPEPVGLGVPARMAMYQPTPRGDTTVLGLANGYTQRGSLVPLIVTRFSVPEKIVNRFNYAIVSVAARGGPQDYGEWLWTSLTVCKHSFGAPALQSWF